MIKYFGFMNIDRQVFRQTVTPTSQVHTGVCYLSAEFSQIYEGVHPIFSFSYYFVTYDTETFKPWLKTQSS